MSLYVCQPSSSSVLDFFSGRRFSLKMRLRSRELSYLLPDSVLEILVGLDSLATRSPSLSCSLAPLLEIVSKVTIPSRVVSSTPQAMDSYPVLSPFSKPSKPPIA